MVNKDEAKGDAATNKEGVPEDMSIVKQLKELDDKYMEIEKEFNAEVMKLQLEYTKLQQPILEERRNMLVKGGDAGGDETGTPGLKGFWLKALQNHPELSENIQTWDEPVLEYLVDIEDFSGRERFGEGLQAHLHIRRESVLHQQHHREGARDGRDEPVQRGEELYQCEDH